MPDSGRCNALAFTVKNRFFVSTGRYFAGIYTGGHVKNDIMEYDPESDAWHVRGTLPEGVENAVSFVINDVVYVGYGEDITTINDKLWKIVLP
jgi:N-acetylneuraminic acid mutarotase